MKLIAIDLGKTYGWAYKDNNGIESGEGTYTELTDWGKSFADLLDKWKPDIVVLSQTNNFGHWNASRCMLMQAGVAFYICGKRGIPGVELNDSTARKQVFGKAIKKIEVQKLRPGFKPNELDACVLAEGWAMLDK